MNKLAKLSSTFLFSIIFALGGCGGGPVTPATTPTTSAPPAVTIGGTVNGLAAGASIVLQNNGADNLTVSANGTFTFATKVNTGSAYNVTILTPPAGQSCTLTYGAATAPSANVTNINVICGPAPVGAFSAGVSMTTPRAWHTVTLLANGKVLAAGGINYGVGPQAINPFTVLSSAEIFDPATNSWSPTGSMANVREAHTATLLSDGKVLVVGGSSTYYNTLNTAEVYDPATGAWSSAGIMANPHQNHTATLLPNGKVLVAGGCASPVTGATYACAELYDPATSTWAAAGAMLADRSLHRATLLPNGKVLVAGGSNSTGNAGTVTRLATAELYNPAADTWTAAGSMTTARAGFYSALLPSGKVVVTDGVTSETYDPASNAWTAAGNLPVALGTNAVPAPFSALLPTGKVLAIDKNVSAELFDPATNTWTVTSNLPAFRVWPAGTLLPNGKLLIAGGWVSGSVSTNTTLLYW